MWQETVLCVGCKSDCEVGFMKGVSETKNKSVAFGYMFPLIIGPFGELSCESRVRRSAVVESTNILPRLSESLRRG